MARRPPPGRGNTGAAEPFAGPAGPACEDADGAASRAVAPAALGPTTAAVASAAPAATATVNKGRRRSRRTVPPEWNTSPLQTPGAPARVARLPRSPLRARHEGVDPPVLEGRGERRVGPARQQFPGAVPDHGVR